MKRKIKNIILIFITYMAFLVFITSIALLDSENNVPFYVSMILSLGWLYLFARANEKGEIHD